MIKAYSNKKTASIFGEEVWQLQRTTLDILIELVFVIRIVRRDSHEHFIEHTA